MWFNSDKNDGLLAQDKPNMNPPELMPQANQTQPKKASLPGSEKLLQNPNFPR